MKIWLILLRLYNTRKSGLFIDGATEAVKHEIKKDGFLRTLMAPKAAS